MPSLFHSTPISLSLDSYPSHRKTPSLFSTKKVIIKEQKRHRRKTSCSITRISHFSDPLLKYTIKAKPEKRPNSKKKRKTKEKPPQHHVHKYQPPHTATQPPTAIETIHKQKAIRERKADHCPLHPSTTLASHPLPTALKAEQTSECHPSSRRPSH